jgi:hypothetical protein
MNSSYDMEEMDVASLTSKVGEPLEAHYLATLHKHHQRCLAGIR